MKTETNITNRAVPERKNLFGAKLRRVVKIRGYLSAPASI